MPDIEYEVVSGFFAQDMVDADPVAIGAVPPRFGLLDASPERWKTFKSVVEKLNNDSVCDASYKVFFLGRHGQGYHNAAESKYGTQAWDDYWSKLDGDGELTWGPDPLLTPLGESQAADARNEWEAELLHGIPLPEKAFSSPLQRAMRTYLLTFDGIAVASKPLVLENCREEYGIHTCDKRHPRSWIQLHYPQFLVEDGFSEQDVLWKPDARETKTEVKTRAKNILDRIFTLDSSTYISITAHGGIINGLLACIGRDIYSLPTGGVLPVVIKGVRREQN
ncbi:phosphoglycerate mutase-like protein [Guyanagaster necrorhizus]|uniref:Phosphoglycerate mutase-like protein n=1 Tax=Guyanagaster necrorhizus TaxID=856835 RepID=A0A9P7VLA8_9AGAR|nr:phosphoglycerate mutase-like protein [Guyanagaster necrorhizus MCA 3950]KAG7443233.1 phosphoglycerate mutase-like protein [Guyanagaster necrorhizus MCA 3950]